MNIKTTYISIIAAICFLGALGSFGFSNPTQAATIFEDNFEGYNTGSLNNQGGWTSDSGGVSVHESIVKEGSRAIGVFDPFGFGGNARKQGALTQDGQITIYFHPRIGFNFKGIPGIRLLEGGTDVLVVGSYPGGGVYFPAIWGYYNGDINGYSILPYLEDAWNSLQIQWRSQDHKARYRINNNSWSDWHPGLKSWSSGLDGVELGSVNGLTYFDAIQENLFNETKTPVLIVPGVLGTEMKKGGEVLWPNVLKMISSISDDFMDLLQFESDLLPIDNDILVDKIIAEPFPREHYYDLIIQELISQSYIEDTNLFTFPYDWRYGVSGKYPDNKTNPNLLSEKIQDILDQSGSTKVNIIAHSMGGLLVKQYVIQNPTNHHIDKAVFVGVPNTGSVKAVKTLLEGDYLGMSFFLNQEEIKKLAENMPVIYDLLPSQKYYDVQGSFVTVADLGSITDFSDDIIKDLTYEEFKSFLTDDHQLNSLALTGAENLHIQDFDDFDVRATGVDLFSINGCKKGTINNIVEGRFNIAGQDFTTYRNIEFKTGDGTVPISSSTNLPIDQSNKFYALKADHSKMPSQDGIRQLITNLLAGSNLQVNENLITQDINQCQLNGKSIEVYSPVDIEAIDQNNNRLGLAQDLSLQNDIPNAAFEIMGEHKFIYLPEDNNQNYIINLKGTGNGSYTIKVNDIQNSQVTKSEYFINLPVTQDLTGNIILGNNQSPTALTVKEVPEGPEDTITPQITSSGEPSSQDIISPVSNLVVEGTIGRSNFYRSEVNLIIKAQDTLISGLEDQYSGISKISYNLDDQGWQEVEADEVSIEVSQEGNHTLKFFSTDNKGNQEPEQTINFTIDQTPPEAIIQFDSLEKDLKFTGTDNISDTSLLIINDQDSVTTITDQAGNTTELKLKDKDRKKSMSAEIKSLAYNGAFSDINKNKMQFSWNYDKNGLLKKLSQHVKSKKDYNITATYDGTKTKLSGKDSSGKINKVVNGLVILKVTTNNGDFSWSY